MLKDVKTKLIQHFKETNPECFIIHPILDKNAGFKNIDVQPPLAEKYPTTKFKLTNLQTTFEIRSSEESLKQEVFAVVGIKSEIYSIAFFIEDLSKSGLIDFQSLYNIIEEARKSTGIEAENFKSSDTEIINHKDFIFSKKITIITPKINISPVEVVSFKNEFKKGNANLRIVTEQDVDIIKKYHPENIETLKKSIRELKELLKNEPDGYEDLFQKKIESNLKILDLYGKKFISHPKGFTSTKKNIQGYKTLIPDFLVESYDGAVNIIEIERPNKYPIRQNGNPNEKFTQALSQIKQWEDLLTQPQVVSKLMIDYEQINKPHKRKYTLIFGRNDHFKDESEKKEFFSQNLSLSVSIEIYTFDDFITKAEKLLFNIAGTKEGSPWADSSNN
jgi:hypothetical protein